MREKKKEGGRQVRNQRGRKTPWGLTKVSEPLSSGVGRG